MFSRHDIFFMQMTGAMSPAPGSAPTRWDDGADAFPCLPRPVRRAISGRLLAFALRASLGKEPAAQAGDRPN
jgi:hypothetical protein